MVRLFNVYYPKRTLFLVGGEAVVVSLSFLLATFLQLDEERRSLVLLYENGYLKILGITAVALLCSYYFDLYDFQRVPTRGEAYFRLLVVLGTFSLLLAAADYFFPEMSVGPGVYLLGVSILTLFMLLWRTAFDWLLRLPLLCENVFVLGSGERAQQLIAAIRSRPELGMQVAGWAGALSDASLNHDALAAMLVNLKHNRNVDRVIVALADRRGTLPVRELLDLRLSNVKVEEASSVFERINGKIEVDDLRPSALIFSDGFRLNTTLLFARRVFSFLFSAVLLLVVLPLLPLVILAIKLTSPGPVLYRQERMGRGGQVFYCYKFRTMRQDAEADTGPTWAGDTDPRITPVGRFLRKTRLDEIPQLWNVFKGDMSFVGPRPERPEFVKWLSQEIPYYHLRHIVRPGLTGWAQVCYEYGASLEQSKEKLKYDLYYIKHLSLAFDMFIIFQTIKIVLFGRGAR